jgi:hypothetical protein
VPNSHLLKKPRELGGPREILKAGPGYKNVINADLVDDPVLTVDNINVTFL